ncbi:hypothetical protein [Streptomyces hirsutus]|uniref:hypothetical protein n=1 Tax=Streptomyces hirsutus TaxID=35620 RepID=UPI0036A86B2B
MRIQLAHWHQGHPPGAEIDVDDAEFASLRRDGRVAAVVEVAPAADTEEVAGAVPAEPADEPPAKTRRRR